MKAKRFQQQHQRYFRNKHGHMPKLVVVVVELLLLLLLLSVVTGCAGTGSMMLCDKCRQTREVLQ
jgi:hypothetical protein